MIWSSDIQNTNKGVNIMVQQEWDVLVCVVPNDEPLHYAGSVKAFTKREAEERGTRLARGRGLSGLIEVQLSGPMGNLDYNTWQ